MGFLDPRSRGYRGYAEPPPDPNTTGLPVDAIAAIVAELSGYNDAHDAQQAAADGREGAAALHGIAALPGLGKLLKLAGKGAVEGVKVGSKAIKGGTKAPEPGAVRHATEGMSDRAADYQAQISGLPRGQIYEVNGVKFDGYADGALKEAKGPGYAQFVKDGRFPGSGEMSPSSIKPADSSTQLKKSQ